MYIFCKIIPNYTWLIITPVLISISRTLQPNEFPVTLMLINFQENVLSVKSLLIIWFKSFEMYKEIFGITKPTIFTWTSCFFCNLDYIVDNWSRTNGGEKLKCSNFDSSYDLLTERTISLYELNKTIIYFHCQTRVASEEVEVEVYVE